MTDFLFWFFRPIAEFLGVVALIVVLAVGYYAFLVIGAWLARRKGRP